MSSGCGRIFPGSAPVPAELAAKEARDDYKSPTFLAVDNNNWQNVTIFVQHDGLVSRLGMVTTARRAVFRIEQFIGAMGELRVIAEPTAGGRSNFVPSMRSERIVVRPGQTISFTLESDLARSSFDVR